MHGGVQYIRIEFVEELNGLLFPVYIPANTQEAGEFVPWWEPAVYRQQRQSTPDLLFACFFFLPCFGSVQRVDLWIPWMSPYGELVIHIIFTDVSIADSRLFAPSLRHCWHHLYDGDRLLFSILLQHLLVEPVRLLSPLWLLPWLPGNPRCLNTVLYSVGLVILFCALLGHLISFLHSHITGIIFQFELQQSRCVKQVRRSSTTPDTFYLL